MVEIGRDVSGLRRKAKFRHRFLPARRHERKSSLDQITLERARSPRR